MRNRTSALLLTLLLTVPLVFAAVLFSHPTISQTRDSGKTLPPSPSPEVIKVDVDLVNVDALVLQKKSARVVGGLKKEDFQIFEDGTKQDITHFSQDSLPLSVLVLIDRGGCLDPFREELHRAAREAIDRLKPIDEVALMTFQIESTVVQPFTRNRIMLENAFHRIPPHKGVAPHCLNNVMNDAAEYMVKASNPVGRRVVIMISAVTRMYDCYGGPSGKSATYAIYESGSVVCGLIPQVSRQRLENGIMKFATRLTKVGGVDYMDIHTLANETGGEVLSDKLSKFDTTFQTLIDHLRSRYNMAFVSSNKKRDGTTRKLKLDLTPSIHKSQGKLVLKARRSYIAPKR